MGRRRGGAGKDSRGRRVGMGRVRSVGRGEQSCVSGLMKRMLAFTLREAKPWGTCSSVEGKLQE